MIHLTYSNRTEALLDALVGRLGRRRARGDDPLAPVRIVVPNRNVERYVELGIARRLGIAANLRFERLGALLRRWLGEDLLLEGAMLARVFRALHEEALIGEPALAPVRRYLSATGGSADATEVRRAQLATHLARLFEEYGYSRPELLRAWSAGAARFEGTRHADAEAWQRRVWAWMRSELPGARTLEEALGEAPPPEGELHVFGLSYVARVFASVFARLGDDADLYLYALNPCEEFWEDLETAPELRRRRRLSDAEPEWLFEDEDPFELSVDAETPLLRLWGRPGREHVRLLGALTDCDFTPAFSDPSPPAPSLSSTEGLPLFEGLAEPSLLTRLQRDVLHREPLRRGGAAGRRDDSLKIFACPSLRREVETVAAEIWRAIDRMEGLTFDQIAVLVNGPDRELYLPHLGAVFERARAIPFNVADLSLASVSPVVEAALALLELPTTAFARPDVLSVITHPAVRAGAGDVDPYEWVELVERLGIYRGIDEAAHEGTYAEGEEKLHWEQGLSRIALGAFMDAEGFVTVGAHRHLPEPPRGSGAIEAAFTRLVRSLMSDVRFARRASLSLSGWARFFGAMVSAYLHPSDERERGALRRVLSAVGGLAELDVDGIEVRHAAALELVRGRIAELAGSRGQHLANGVAVSSLLPMRAIPFRVVFVLGLGEGRFPATDRRDSMDLRSARRQAGDVTPSERDRYTFLETLLCARERLVLSYVARDERTGDPLSPSVVVTELLEVIDEGYLALAEDRLVRPVPLRRADEQALAEVLPEADAERRARQLGESLREATADAAARLGPSATSRRVAREPRLAETLGLRPLPRDGEAEPDVATLRLSLAALRRFLDCPMQGWTRAVLRLEDEQRDSPAAESEEPFAPSRLDASVVLRGAFAEAALGARGLEEAYRARIAPLEAHGRWPLGPLEAHHARTHLEVLERWWQRWEQLGPAEAVGRVRFGAARRADPSEEVLDPIVVELAPGPRHPARPLRVELVGRTELLRAPAPSAAEPRASVSALERRPGGARGHLHALRWGLRAFFDHAALSAMGRDGEPHRAVQLYGDQPGGRVTELPFAPLTREEARGWLASLTGDLLGQSHAYLLPVEAVLRFAERFDEARGAALLDSIAMVRDRWNGGQSRWGPVRDPLRYPPPPLGDAEAMVERRFGLIFDRLEAAR